MKKYLFIVSVVALLSSCTTLGTLSYDRLQAAEISYPEQVKSVAIINNMPPSGVVEGSASDLLSGEGTIVAESLAQAIAAMDYFDRVVVCDSSMYASSAPDGLSQVQVDSLLRVLDVDMLFTLNKVYIQLKENSVFVPGLPTPLPVIDGIVTPVVQSYVSGRSNPLFVVTKSDSIYWEMDSSLDLQRVIADASEFAATIPMKQLLPYWVEVDRNFYNGGSLEMRDAAVYVKEGDWDSAFHLWKEVYDKKKGAAKMRAAYNIALYFEMQNDIQQAEKYLTEALQLAEEGSLEKNMMEVYQLQLNELVNETWKLEIQMRRFDNIF